MRYLSQYLPGVALMLQLGSLVALSSNSLARAFTPSVLSGQGAIKQTAILDSKSAIASPTDKNVKQGLEAALHAVVTLNPAVKGKRDELNAQCYALDSAKAARLPSLSGHASSVNDYDQATLQLQQPLWAFGKIDGGIAKAQADVLVEEQGLLKVQRQLIEETASAYAKIEGINQRIKVAQVNIDEHKRLHQRINRRFAGQLASEADVRFAYSRLVQASAQLSQIKGELQVALADLQSLTQVVVDTKIPVDQNLAALPSLTDVRLSALKNSADIHIKQQRLESVRLDIALEKAAALPTISFRVEQELLDIGNNGNETRAGFVIEGNLDGLGFVTKGRIDRAVARLNAAQQDLSATKNEVSRRISTLMLNRQVQFELRYSQQDAVDAVEATMASFLRQYETARKSWIDVLNTQRELTELRFHLVKIENDWLILSLRTAALIGSLDLLAGIESL